MRAVQLTADLDLVDVELPDPAAGPGDVVVDVVAAGICHSDAHYRRGAPAPGRLPVVLGHEVAGRVAAIGPGVTGLEPGHPVAIHYVVACGRCRRCTTGQEMFCADYAMVGNSRDGGFAEKVRVPARNVVPVPERLDLRHAAVMMCSSATALHALERGHQRPGEVVAVFGVGGLGMSAIQLARARGAATVVAVEPDAERRGVAADLGAVAVTPDAAPATLAALGGADVALELVGSPLVMRDAIDALGPGGRAVAVGLTLDAMELAPYLDLVGRERAMVGSNDHTLAEIHALLAHTLRGELDLSPVVTAETPLAADAIAAELDRLEGFGPGIRTVVTP